MIIISWYIFLSLMNDFIKISMIRKKHWPKSAIFMQWNNISPHTNQKTYTLCHSIVICRISFFFFELRIYLLLKMGGVGAFSHSTDWRHHSPCTHHARWPDISPTRAGCRGLIRSITVEQQAGDRTAPGFLHGVLHTALSSGCAKNNRFWVLTTRDP